jgi:stress response protein YsnF
MTNRLTIDELQTVRGADVLARDGDKIGTVEEVFVDQATGAPEWIGIGTGFLRMKRVLVPAQGAALRDDGVHVAYSKQQVKDSPDIDDDEISQQTEASLYAHYGLRYSQRRSETGLPEGGGTGRRRGRGKADTEGEAAVTRHEEELAVGKRAVEAGRLRLHKWVETEPVSEEVELRRERATVQRQAMDEPVSDAAMGDQDVEVRTWAEEPVVEKRTKAKERVTVDKEAEAQRRTVSDEVRKERVGLEGEEADVDDRR